jgi:hypothetical protein
VFTADDPDINASPLAPAPLTTAMAVMPTAVAGYPLELFVQETPIHERNHLILSETPPF